MNEAEYLLKEFWRSRRHVYISACVNTFSSVTEIINLKTFYTNACLLFNKRGEIKCIINSSDIDIICITETHQ